MRAMRLMMAIGAAGTMTGAATVPADPWMWMEELRGERVMVWVKEANARSTGVLEKDAVYGDVKGKVLEVLNSRERIPGIVKHGSRVYNFWRDGKNPRGLWRRTTMAEYRKPLGETAWETVLDLDALAAAEKENWVWGGVAVLEVAGGEPARALVQLSRGGGDAEVVREFDLQKRAFVEGGFVLPEAKSRVAWGDEETVYVGTDFGPGSLTTSGYPRVVKEWKRGMPLAAAKTVFEGQVTDMGAGVSSYLDHGVRRVMLYRQPTLFTNEQYLRQGEAWVKLEKPGDAEVSTFRDKVLIELRTEWDVGAKKFKGGSLLAADLEKYLEGERDLTVLFEPTERTALVGTSSTKHYLIVNTLENVVSKPLVMREEGGRWATRVMETVPLTTVRVRGLDDEESDEVLVETAGYLTPSTLALGDAARPEARAEVLKQLPSFFNAAGLEVKQFQATSKDGTRVPYFQVGRKGMALDGSNPTLMYGYGGFQISLQPGYSAEVGRAWLEKGGVYVVANIRGGGEFGPAWHEAARKEKRQRAYDDFAAVAEDLHARKVTSPAKLGIMGGSNGGLLTGVMLTQRPELFGAVVIGSPLLDMGRYIHLPAGASWIDEYGDPSKPEEWAYISRYSPYQNVKRGVKYPPVMIATSTMDDRVHPGHARKFAARLIEAGHEVWYYENTEGGHSAAANHAQRAHIVALEYAFLWRVLGAK